MNLVRRQLNTSKDVLIKSASDIRKMREACKLAARTLKRVGEMVKPGVSTEEINQFVYVFTLDHGAIPAPLGYGGFPKSVCTSVNDVVCNGIPSPKEILRKGDIINVDVTPILNGFHGDTSATFCVGIVKPKARKLVETARQCLDVGIQAVKPGNRILDIGIAIQDYAEARGYSVVRSHCGHGVGRLFHEPLLIPHYRCRGPSIELVPGMIFTIEPMINIGGHATVTDPVDNWTVRTVDGSLSAQFEHTVLVTEDGVDVLTDWRYIQDVVGAGL